MKILIAEDDARSMALLTKYLESRGHAVLPAEDGQIALETLETEDPDLILLDVMMPRVDGWQVLEHVREMSDTPVIMVTVKDATDDKVRGLSGGVDDYIIKPFDLQEVEARIEAVMRRYGTPSHTDVGPLSIDDETKEVKLHGEPIELSPKEYDLLSYLASKPGRVFSQDEILGHVWSDSPYAGAEDVKKYVYLLRNKLKERGAAELVKTVRGFGYKLNVEEE